MDLHTHLREPGREDAETVETGTLAAAMGGFTAVFAMANTDPVADTAGVVEQVWRLGREAGHCDVYPVGAVTVGLGGERLAELGAMADSAAHVRVFSDDGKCVSDAVLMRRALEYVKAFDGVVAQHAQEPRLTEDAQMNEGELSGRLGLRGWPAVAEEAIIARDCLLAAHVGSRLHICHVSTAGSVEIVRWAKSKGWPVTAEACPHHLLLTDELAATYDPIYKVNPPLRSAVDVEALREGLADGTIDIVATDHAPHPHEDKDCEWQAAAFGMIGLETALSIVQQTMVDTGLLDWAGRRASGCRPSPRRSAGPPTTAARWRSVSPPTWCSTTPPPAGWWTPARPRRCRATRRTPAWSCPAASSPRSCAASPPSSTASRRDGRMSTWQSVLVLLALLLLAYLAMWRGWRRRAKKHDLPPLVPTPPVADLPEAKLVGGARYFGTTVSGDWLDRVVAHGLGARQRLPAEPVGRGPRRGPARRLVPHPRLRAARRPPRPGHRRQGRAAARPAGRDLAARRPHPGHRLPAHRRGRAGQGRHRGPQHLDPVDFQDGQGERMSLDKLDHPKALLVLEDGRTFHGEAYGAEGETFGEAVFSTGMTGYQETLTDPSYHRQVVVMTAPHVGNTGMNDEDPESRKIWVSGYVVRDPARVPSNWRSTRSLDDALREQGVVGISGIDTRALTRHLRERGAMRVGISTTETDPDALLRRVLESAEMAGAELAGEVSTSETYVVPAQGEKRFTVAALDLGIKATPRG